MPNPPGSALSPPGVTSSIEQALTEAITEPQPRPLVSRLTVATTRNLTAYAGTGMTLPVEAGKNYRIHARGQYQTAALTTGIGLRIGGTATATGVRYQTIIFGLAATTFTVQAIAAIGASPAASTAVAVANTDYPWQIDGLIRVATAGTVTLDFASKVANSVVTVQPDSFLYLEELP